MKHALVALGLAALSSPALAEGPAGFEEMTIPAPHHGRDMQIAVTYPADEGARVIFAENAVFEGVPLMRAAAPRQGRYPVILLSPGWGGSYARMAWLSAGLAEKGAIVLAVNHPGSTLFDTDTNSALTHWTRAADLSHALDFILQNETFSAHIDAGRIYAAGFSYGGWTALSLAGVRGRLDGFSDYCTAAGSASRFCADLSRVGGLSGGVDRGLFEASYRDARIGRVAAIDPGLTWGLSAEDVAGAGAPMLLLGLGEGAARLRATDTGAGGSNFEALVPGADAQVIAPASHFSALGLCKPAGEAILKDEGDDPVCSDPAGTDRAAVLAEIIRLMADHFALE